MVTGPMPRKPKATRPKAKTAGGHHERASRPMRADTQYAMPIRTDEDDAHPVGAEVTGGEAGQDVERRAAFAGRGDDLVARGAIRST